MKCSVPAPRHFLWNLIFSCPCCSSASASVLRHNRFAGVWHTIPCRMRCGHSIPPSGHCHLGIIHADISSAKSRLSVGYKPPSVRSALEIEICNPRPLHGNQMLLQAMHQSDNLVFQLSSLGRSLTSRLSPAVRWDSHRFSYPPPIPVLLRSGRRKWRNNPLSTSIDVVTRKNITSMNQNVGC